MIDHYRSISNAISFIESHLTDFFTIEDVSREAFTRAFQAEYEK